MAKRGTRRGYWMKSMDGNLEEFKQKVEQSLLKNNGCSTREAKRLTALYDADFPELMRQFSEPKVASLAMVMSY